MASYVSYTSLGNTVTPGGGFQAGTFTLCNQSAGKNDTREIVIASSGRPRTRKVSCALGQTGQSLGLGQKLVVEFGRE